MGRWRPWRASPSGPGRWGAFEQIGRLRDEGIAVDDLGNLDLEAHRWRP